MTCTASVSAIRELRSRGAMPARDDADGSAAEGTVAHEVRETALRTGTSPFDQIGRKLTVDGHSYVVDEHMADHLVAGIDWLREQLEEIEVELRVRLDPWMPNQIGTLDAGGQPTFDLMLINDFKYGIGNYVEAERNKQVMLYALGYWHRLGRPDVGKVLITIDQPRRGGMRFWETDLEELRAFGDEVSAVYLRIATGDVEYQASPSACRWCPMKDSDVGCAAYDEMFLRLFRESLDPLTELLGAPRLRNPEHISPDLRRSIVQLGTPMKAWLDGIKKATVGDLLNGASFDGIKLVRERGGSRKYGDEARAATILMSALGLDAYQPAKLIGVTDAEKLLKPGVRKQGHPEAWAELTDLFDYGEDVLSAVPDDDPRPALIDLADEFDDL